ncbi:CoA-binding protein, partial [Candidatus Bathyarchaeota archaeon CG_4_8_14_3_um_filter_42_8]
MDRDDLREILTRYKTVAVVGLSRDPSKDSYRVAEYLKRHGFHIV